jgi:hypothetical protein
MCRALWITLFLISGSPAVLFGRSRKLVEIDDYCQRVQAEFREAAPITFAGPDPWVQVDEALETARQDAVAYVYAAGPRIVWVFLQLNGAREIWHEDVYYFFREDGTLAKRKRNLEDTGANIALEVLTYYDHGRILKQKMHRHALGPGRQRMSAFEDEDAPEYLTVDDLPFPRTAEFWKRLARSTKRAVDVPDEIVDIFEANRQTH